MARTVAIGIVAAMLAVGGVGTILFLAYGVDDEPPAFMTVAALDAPAFVLVYPSGAARVEARSDADAIAALGFAHGAEHGWMVTLSQRTARGQLSSWLGNDLVPVDALARRLGLAEMAREAYARLPDAQRSLLDAYADGMNAGLDASSRRDEFAALRTTPDRWEPWYTLAVARLYAWLAVPPQNDDAAMPAELRRFLAADDLLRRLLHLYGFESSMAWTMSDLSGTRLAQRHVLGASAVPLYQSVELAVDDAGTTRGATLLGTPFFPAGRNDQTAWSVLLSGTVELEPSNRDTAAIPHVYERIEAADGAERVLHFRRAPGSLFFPFEEETPVGDSLSARSSNEGPTGWELRWAGLDDVSDAAAWFALSDGSPVPFTLYDGDGLLLSATGTTQVLGNPLFVYEHDRGVAVGNSAWSRHAAARLDSLSASEGSTVPAALDDYFSPWAARRVPLLLESLDGSMDTSPLVSEALAYLRNWDYNFDGASIAASIFEAWTLEGAARRSLDDLADAPPQASLDALLAAVERTAARLSSDPSQWRWEDAQPHHYFFPVWSADSLVSIDLNPLARTRYAPITIREGGHLSTLHYGPSALDGRADAPARWEGWISTSDWEQFHFRSRRFQANRFFGRYLVSDHIPPPASLPDAGTNGYTTTLHPE